MYKLNKVQYSGGRLIEETNEQKWKPTPQELETIGFKKEIVTLMDFNWKVEVFKINGDDNDCLYFREDLNCSWFYQTEIRKVINIKLLPHINTLQDLCFLLKQLSFEHNLIQ